MSVEIARGPQNNLLSRYLDHIGDGSGYTNGNIKVASLGNATFAAATHIWTLTSHTLKTGDAAAFTASGTGAEPFVVTTIYYVIRIDDNTFYLALTQALAIVGTKIEGTGTNSVGTWTIKRSPTSLMLKPAADVIYRVASLVLLVRDTTGFTEEEYGNLGSTLTNGILVRESNAGGVITNFTDSETIKMNSDFSRLCGAREVVTDLGVTNDYLVATLKFEEQFGQSVRLVGDNGEFLEVVLQDDLTGLLAHYFLARGSIEHTAA